MKFRMFEDYITGEKVAVNVDHVMKAVEKKDCCEITIAAEAGCAAFVSVAESFDVVISRLNTGAE